jgi:glycosyltransferase involved in cell wall biosynthesis
MKVLTICPTYGRLPYLGRFVASFLSQTHTNSDLVIINDDSNINVVCDIDRVTVININKKQLVDVKRNIGAIMGLEYDLIMPWDDDDIFLPSQIEYHVQKFKENPDIELFRNTQCFITYNNAFDRSTNSPNSIAYTPSAYLKYGAYNHFLKDGAGDASFYNKISNKLVVDEPEHAYFVYNFSGVNYHLSSNGNEDNIVNIATQQREKLNISGTYVIEPDFEEFKKFIDLSQRVINGERNIQVSFEETPKTVKLIY